MILPAKIADAIRGINGVAKQINSNSDGNYSMKAAEATVNGLSSILQKSKRR